MNLLRPRFSHTSAVDCKRMSTHFFSLLAVITLGLVMPTGQAQPSPPVGNLPGKIPDEQLFGFIGKDPLPAGTVPWQLLRQVKLVEVKGKSAKAGAPQVLPEFGPRIQELDKKRGQALRLCYAPLNFRASETFSALATAIPLPVLRLPGAGFTRRSRRKSSG